MIRRDATRPFAFSDQGILPTDHSSMFTDVERRYLQRLLPREATVP
jgi:hypothetical protein